MPTLRIAANGELSEELKTEIAALGAVLGHNPDDMLVETSQKPGDDIIVTILCEDDFEQTRFKSFSEALGLYLMEETGRSVEVEVIHPIDDHVESVFRGTIENG